ncbi:flagellar hook-associated protein FlgK [Paenibacillus sacheonensis]|uniref:Flagellar hook-associated protein 1 n=1 Tax=Paenibacillus sacheonensis TaxID=742054 RepID=A0A7X4YV82_9BACL|nr:flagellar hook-associated protein FlgK [Paenibacillus sacheonensis]MBM7566480.1 flagellar hook-associated protein 1 FlgK [Paenibacillus sacheonensis]NBC73163.1 flagellar hook-associated protein FlgK [Paenibacillus sacheonensis]
MASTFHSIETAKRSLFATRSGLGTLGHNIANANTEGYSRQRIDLRASRPIEAFGMSHSTAAGQIGTGVEAVAINRIRSSFLDVQYRDENKYVGNWEVRSDTLGKLEAVVNEPSDTGIRTVLDRFWTAWSDLSKDPENTTNREIVKQTSLALVDSFNQTSKQLQSISDDLTGSIDTKVQQANVLLHSIGDLNAQIKRIESLGDSANDLRDQRDLYSDQLSKMMNVNVSESTDGYNISMGGTPLVQGTQVTDLTAASVEGAYSSGDLNNGEFYGLITSRDVYVKGYQDQLDTIAKTLAEGEIQVTIPKGAMYNGVTLTNDQVVTVNGINGLHKLGFTNEAGATRGDDFFTFDTTSGAAGITAGSIRLNPAIVTDSNKIAVSMRTETTGSGVSVVKGNNALALLISQMKDGKFSFDETATGGPVTSTTMGTFYNSMVGAIGIQAQEANRQYENATTMMTQAESSRQSVSGVSLDEEMSNMIVFQNAYNAAARFMTVIDETLDKLINSTGTVGR